MVTAGIQCPYKRLFMMDSCFQRQKCRGCELASVNAAGVRLNFFCRRIK